MQFTREDTMGLVELFSKSFPVLCVIVHSVHSDLVEVMKKLFIKTFGRSFFLSLLINCLFQWRTCACACLCTLA